MARSACARDRWLKGFGQVASEIEDFVGPEYGLNLHGEATESIRSKNSFKMGISTDDFYVYFFDRPSDGGCGNFCDRRFPKSSKKVAHGKPIISEESDLLTLKSSPNPRYIVGSE